MRDNKMGGGKTKETGSYYTNVDPDSSQRNLVTIYASFSVRRNWVGALEPLEDPAVTS